MTDNNNKEEPAQQQPSKNGYELPKNVAILYSDVKREYFPTEESYITEKGALKYASVVSSYINKLGIETNLIPGNDKIVKLLKKYKPKVVFNLVDSYKGSDYLSSTIPAVLELLDFPYTGADSMGLSLSTNKFLVTKVLQANGIPTPHSQLFTSASDYLDPTLRFPLISKLNETHGSVEINQDSISENERHLRDRLKLLINTYKQPVLVEEFIVGREISAVLLEGLNKKVYLGERIFPEMSDKYQFVTFDIKWLREPANYQKYEDPILREYVKKAFAVCNMFDYGRFDIRIDSSGRYFFLDSNPNPFLGPKETDSSMGIILDMYGVDFEETIKRLLINTIRDSLGKERLPFPQSPSDMSFH